MMAGSMMMTERQSFLQLRGGEIVMEWCFEISGASQRVDETAKVVLKRRDETIRIYLFAAYIIPHDRPYLLWANPDSH